MPSTDQYTRREARIRGSGTKIKVEELNIEAHGLPNDPLQTGHNQSIAEEPVSKQSHGTSPKYTGAGTSAKHHDAGTSLKYTGAGSSTANSGSVGSGSSSGLREKRKLTFSSDEDDDDDFAPYKAVDQNAGDSYSLDPPLDQFSTENSLKSAIMDYMPDHTMDEPDIKQEPSQSPPPAQSPKKEPVKRKRGRPKKGESEKKVAVVTRRSRRVEQNPALQKSHAFEVPRVSHPKPFSSMSLLLAHRGRQAAGAGARSLGSNSKGKQRPLTIDAERLYTASTRDRRFNLTTLDVLRHFVDEHSPRPAANDVISENIVLTEFKAHVRFYLDHLSDLHASVVDISHDLASVQRKKNEVRRAIVELKKKHSAVGAELAVERRKYYDMKEKHAEFMSTATAIGELKAAVYGDARPDTAAEVLSSLADVQRVLNPDYGMPAQLRYVVKGLSELTSDS